MNENRFPVYKTGNVVHTSWIKQFHDFPVTHIPKEIVLNGIQNYTILFS